MADFVLPSDVNTAPTVYPKKYAHDFCFSVLCCGYTLTDFPISIRLTSLALWQSNDCPSASKATLMNMDKYFMWIHYERLHNHNKAKHNKTVCIFLGIYCKYTYTSQWSIVNPSIDILVRSSSEPLITINLVFLSLITIPCVLQNSHKILNFDTRLSRLLTNITVSSINMRTCSHCKKTSLRDLSFIIRMRVFTTRAPKSLTCEALLFVWACAKVVRIRACQ